MTNSNKAASRKKNVASVEKANGANNIIHLLKTRFKELKYKKGRISAFAVCLGTILIVNLAMLGVYIPGKGSKGMSIGVEIGIAVVIVIFAISMSASIFGREMQQNVTSLELREGYKQRELFLSRLLELLIESAVFILAITLVNALIISFAGEINNGTWYQLYLASLGWYAIILVITLGLSIFFCSFGGIIASTIVGLLLPLILIICGAMAGIFAMIGEDNPMSGMQDAGKTLLDKAWKSRYKEINNVVFENKDNWRKNNDWDSAKKFIKPEFADKIKNSFKVAEGNNSRMESPYSVKAYYLSFGPEVFKDDESLKEFINNEKIYKFYTDANKYINEINVNVKYDQIDFFKNPTYSDSWSSIPDTPRDEPLAKIVDKLLNKKEMKDNYQDVLKTIKLFSDRNELSSFSESGHSYPEDLFNMNETKYGPTWTKPNGWGPDASSSWSNGQTTWVGGSWLELTNEIKQEKLNPAKIVFFKNFTLSYDEYLSGLTSSEQNNIDVQLDSSNQDVFTYEIKLNNTKFKKGDSWDQYDIITANCDVEATGDNASEAPRGSQFRNYFRASSDNTKIINSTNETSISIYSGYQGGFNGDELQIYIDKGQISKDDVVTLSINYTNSDLYDYDHGGDNQYTGVFRTQEPVNVNTGKAPEGDKAKVIANQMIYNPIVQFSLMMFGINYNNLYINDLANTQGDGLSSFITVSLQKDKKGIEEFKRTSYPEVIYIAYTVFNGLLIWAGSAIFKKKIVL